MTTVRALALRALLLALLFHVLAEGDPEYPVAILAIVATAALASLALLPAGSARVRPAAVIRFVPWFLVSSIRAGADVAQRAFRPALPLEPGFLDYRLQLSSPGARVLFANLLSLLPGTLSVSLNGETLRIHALDTTQPLAERLRELEQRVASLVGAETAD